MLCKPGIIVMLQYERDLGLFFEIISAWHGNPQSLSECIGFRMMELQRTLQIVW